MSSTSGPDLSKLTPKQRALLERRLLERRSGAAGADAIPRRSGDGDLPLSFSQERLWIIEQITPGSPAYHIADAFLVEGALDIGALRRSLDALTARHESLRMTFGTVDGEPVQIVAVSGHVDFAEAKLEASDEAFDDEIQRLLAAESERPFDLERGPLLRVRVFHAGAERHVLLLTMHHIISDAWSRDVLFRDLSTLYDAFTSGRPAPLAELPIQYPDYAAWQRKRFTDEVLDEQMVYWREQLAGCPTLELPAARRRATVARHGRGASAHTVLPKPLTRAIKDLSRAENVAVSMLTLAAVDVLLQRYCGQDDVVVGSPIAGRDREELNDLVGFFVNMLVLRTRLDGDPTVRELLNRVRAVMLDAYEHQEIPFAKLVDGIDPGRDLTRNPLFQVAFQYGRAAGEGPLASTGLTIKPLGVDLRTTRFDVEFHVHERDESILVSVIYDEELFDEFTMQRMLAHYQAVLEGFVADPGERISRVRLLDDDERRRIVVDWNQTATDYPCDVPVPVLFEQQAARTPDAVAVEFGRERLTYGELDRRANQLARHLQSFGVRRGTLVGICIDRSEVMVVAMLAILKAGGAYVPLDPTYPTDRLRFMLEDTDASVVVTTSDLLPDAGDSASHRVCLDREADAIEKLPATPLDVEVTTGDLAYIIYTSGSTGRPKGVVVSHANLLNLIGWHREAYAVTPEDRASQLASLGFDACVWEVWPYLASGASVHVVDDTTRLDPARLWSWLREHAITICFMPTPLAVAALDADAPPVPALRFLLTGGDRLPAAPAERQQAFALINHYGPTEGTVVATAGVVTAAQDPLIAPSIGRPIDNVQAHILDRGMQPVPIGVVGELYIGGHGIAVGYLRRPALTAERFVPNPFGEIGGSRLYRTGDLVRYFANGDIEFVGRVDHQVKVRGLRIELGEIESVLGQFEQVREAVVLCRSDAPGQQRLVAYVVPDGDDEPSRRELREHVAAKLPEYMVPSAFVFLDATPLTPNGKVDRDALPAPGQERQAEGVYVAPRTPAEQVLAGIWTELLRIDRVGVDDNFFELGGDSILGIQVIARAREAGLHLAARQIFEHQTVGVLAAVAEESSDRSVLAEQEPVVGELPLTPIEHWFFEQELADAHHFNQSMLVSVRERLAGPVVEQVVDALLAHHDALRLRFQQDGAGWTQMNAEPGGSVPFECVDLSALAEAEQSAAITTRADALQASLDLNEGPLVRVAMFDLGADRPGRLLIVIHHLAVDGVSWRILLEDLQRAYEQVSRGEEVRLPAKTTSFRQWSERLTAHAASEEMLAELATWTDQPWEKAGSLPVVGSVERNTSDLSRSQTIELSEEETRALLQEVPRAYNTQIDDVLLTALVRAFAPWTGRESLLVDLEGHGREAMFDDVDLSRTVGWFTAMYPVLLHGGDSNGKPLRGGAALTSIKEQLRSVPNRGIGYGLLRYLCDDAAVTAKLAALPHPEVSFNYLGQFDQMVDERSLFGPAAESMGAGHSPRGRRNHLIDVMGAVAGGRLQMSFVWGSALHEEREIAQLAERYRAALVGLIAHCTDPESGGCTPSDFPLATVDQRMLDELVSEYGPRGIEDLYPLSPMQLGMAYHSASDPTSGVYVQQMCFGVDGLDVETFKRSWATIVARHSVLRTSVVGVGSETPLQLVHVHLKLPVTEHDLRELTEDEQAAWLETFQSEDRVRGFDLADPPLMRLSIIRRGERRYDFVWTFHHILLDGWSFPAVINEVFAVYGAQRRGEDTTLPRVRPYGQYIGWLQAQDPEEARSFWQRTLGDFATPTRLGEAMGKLDAAGTPERCDHEMRSLSAELTEALQGLASRHQVTMNTLVAGAWSLLLSRYSGESDVVFGTIVSGRPADLDGVESMVGMFVNTLPLRVSIPDETALAAWLRDLQAHQAELRQYEYSPLWQVQHEAALPAGTPLFDSLYVFENFPVDVSAVQESELKLSLTPPVERTGYPLMLSASLTSRLGFKVTYDCNRFEVESIRRLLDHLQTLLEGMVDAPETRLGAVSMLSETERRRLLIDWNDTAVDLDADRCIHELFAAQARRSPDATALVVGETQLTFRELDRKSNWLAHELRARGADTEVPIAICMERTADMVVGILAILKAGGAYVPLDPKYPADRLRYILDDVRAPLLLTTRDLVEELSMDDAHVVCVDADWPDIEGGAEVEMPPASRSAPGHIAYVIYTSGSTGRPKGVAMTHANAASLLLWAERVFDVDDRRGLLASTSICFDLSVFELFLPLCFGGTVILAENALELPTLPARDEVTLINTVPSAISELLRQEEVPATVRTVCLAGEPLTTEIADRLYDVGVKRVFDLYGPSEDTTYSTFMLRERGGPATIGRPIANEQVYILDRSQRPMPIGVAGELYLGGPGVARGYFNRPGPTAERFVPDPFTGEPGARLYRTGDLGRYRPDGNIEFLGRIDHQVKLRGFRIELGEIEAVLGQHAQVREAVVLCRSDAPGQKRLVAYVVSDGDAEPSRRVLREHVTGKLPEFMVPSAFVLLDALPLTPNGKVNRKALPAPGTERPADGVYVAPRTPAEQVLAGIWSELLGVDRVGIHDNFFELGGDSILGIQVIARARDAGLVLAARHVFQHQSMGALAAAAGGTSVIAEQGPVVGELPLTPIEHWFLEQELADAHHFNHSMLLSVPERLAASVVEQAVEALLAHHDALRLRFERSESGWRQVNAEPGGSVPFECVDLSALAEDEQSAAITAKAQALQASLDLGAGPLVRVALFGLGKDRPGRLLIVIHHLAVDGVSWRILLEDLQRACESLTAGEPVQLPAKTTSFLAWARRIHAYAQSDDLVQELDHWLEQPWSHVGSVGSDHEGGDNTFRAMEGVTASLTESETMALLQEVPEAYNTQINDVLLTALAETMAVWTERDAVLIDLEGHGREDLFDDIDVSRTVGWFTTIFPVVLDLRECGAEGWREPGMALKSVKEQLRSIPYRGIGYGMLRYLTATDSGVDRLARLPHAQVSFNYLGQFDQMFDGDSMFGSASESAGSTVSLRNRRSHLIGISASIFGGQLQVNLAFSADIFDRTTMDRFAAAFMESLRELIDHCRSKTDRDFTPSDFPIANLDEDELSQVSDLLARLDEAD